MTKWLFLVCCLGLAYSGKLDTLLRKGESDLQWKNRVQLAIRDGKVEELQGLITSHKAQSQSLEAIDSPCCGRGTALTPLQFACKEGNVPSTRTLIRLGANLHTPHEGTGTTPLMFAAREGSTAALDTMLFSNPDRSPLEKPALRDGWSSATLDATDEHGNTALLLSANLGHAEVAELLLAAGANPLAVSSVGNNAWQISAFYCSGGRKYIDAIFKFGLTDHVDDQAPNGRNALMLAASGNQLDCLQALLENGAQVNAKSAVDSKSALDISKEKGHAEITAALERASHDEL